MKNELITITARLHDAVLECIQDDDMIEEYETQDLIYSISALLPMALLATLLEKRMDVLEVNHFTNRLIMQNVELVED
jgi:hypothetical protein